jgi:hypothetical protein
MLGENPKPVKATTNVCRQITRRPSQRRHMNVTGTTAGAARWPVDDPVTATVG